MDCFEGNLKLFLEHLTRPKLEFHLQAKKYRLVDLIQEWYKYKQC